MRARRSSLVIALAVAALSGLLVAAAAPVVAQQDPKQKEIDELRAQLDTAQAEKARAENEKDELLHEIQRLRMGAGAGVPAAGGDPLSRSVTLDLTNAPMTAAFRELGEKVGCKPDLDAGVPAKATVSVRFKDLPGRIAIDLVCWNAKQGGRPVELAWRIDEGTLTVERAPK